jgi:tRNA pseudouridine38-40 synthase
MSRYFLEVSYRGTDYSGFQTQQNANTIQAEVEKAMHILFRLPSPLSGEGQGLPAEVPIALGTKAGLRLTGSSRTDTGVHALQNYFHFDYDEPVHPQFIYKINAILPADIVVKNLYHVRQDAHCRFDAVSREYCYYIYRQKDGFLKDRAFYFPYKVDFVKMREAAMVIKGYTDFTSFSKRNTQVKTFECCIEKSEWIMEGNAMVYRVIANRFLRGMVRAMVATMLKLGRGKITVDEFKGIIEAKDCTLASFAVPGHGLFLRRVEYPVGFEMIK